MEKRESSFENFVFNKLLQKAIDACHIDGEIYSILKKQHEQAIITYRYTEVGFFFDYTMNNIVVPAGEHVPHVLGGVNFKVVDNPNLLIGMLLFIDNGIISCTEGHGYGDYIDEKFLDPAMLTETTV